MSTADKGYKGAAMEGLIAKWYARNTAKSTPAFQADAQRVGDLLAPSAQVLEVAPGPGYFVIELAKLGDFQITGLDISKTFVEIATQNATQAGVHAAFRLGSASHMPFDDNQFDFIFCRAAFKNFSQPLGALQEMYRVLKPRGRVLIVDLRRDASLESIRQGVADMHLGAFNAWLTRLIFRYSLLRRAYTKAEFADFLHHAQFSSFEIKTDGIGMDVWLGK
jgi:ubiquinone/menaquinone biosynthesis C-methylase UbiE